MSLSCLTFQLDALLTRVSVVVFQALWNCINIYIMQTQSSHKKIKNQKSSCMHAI